MDVHHCIGGVGQCSGRWFTVISRKEILDTSSSPMKAPGPWIADDHRPRAKGRPAATGVRASSGWRESRQFASCLSMLSYRPCVTSSGEQMPYKAWRGLVDRRSISTACSPADDLPEHRGARAVAYDRQLIHRPTRQRVQTRIHASLGRKLTRHVVQWRVHTSSSWSLPLPLMANGRWATDGEPSLVATFTDRQLRSGPPTGSRHPDIFWSVADRACIKTNVPC